MFCVGYSISLLSAVQKIHDYFYVGILLFTTELQWSKQVPTLITLRNNGSNLIQKPQSIHHLYPRFWSITTSSISSRPCVFREGRSNAHIKGDYQRIGDVMLKNLQALKVSWELWSILHDDALLLNNICL